MLRPHSSALASSDFWDDHPNWNPDNGLFGLLNGGLLRSGATASQDFLQSGLNFASQNYLGLAGHPEVRAAALAAMGQHRHASMSDADDRPRPVAELEARIATFLHLPAAVTYPSGTDAIRFTLARILRPGDDILVDAGAHSAMFETILASYARLHRFPSGSVDAVERRLRRLARQPRQGRLMIAVSAVTAHGSKVADLAELCALARSYGATLIADVSHDLGSMGQGGGGVMEIQGCLGRVDIVLGSFAKSFGAAGGFAAFRDPSLKSQALPSPLPQLSPVNASAILAAASIITSPEGRRRRRNLHGITLRLRNQLMANGTRVIGGASPLVPILLPPLTALPRTALLESAGPVVTFLQAPQVPLHAPRWRIELRSDHGLADIDDLADLIRDVRRAFDRQIAPRRAVVALP
jgi:7-keto-8-aminopelargonate synthetase-like enzyme